MNTENLLLPHLVSVLTQQAPVAWIYLALIFCLATRVWLSVHLLILQGDQRSRFLERTYTLSDATGNVSILLGVIGTLIGVTMAVSGKTGNVQPAEFMETFSSAFGIAVSTTIAGGLTYITCLILSSLDGYITGDR
ncbi:MAG TPA: hypothetical protein ENI62_01360 [Gammaproteobacteria bacterium]|nr:hypothetical protein [Gammaproteobacteria bacterium]